MDHKTIVQRNLPKIVEFYKSKLNIKTSPKPDKLRINCPYCPIDYKHPNGDTDFHLVLNLDWGIGKCFHCGEAKSIFSILKHLDIYNDYIYLLKDLTDFSYYDLQTLLKKEIIVTDSSSRVSANKAFEYIKANGLELLDKNYKAREYALSRTRNNETEIASYYSDQDYLYIPITKDKNIVAFIARKYSDNSKKPRYKYIKIDEASNPVGFIDEVEENLSGDTVYISEGYFDALAINSSFGDYRAIAVFSKSNISKAIDNLYAIVASDTRIVIALDSPNKDLEIFSSIDQFYKKLKNYFQNISICILPDNDLSYIFTEYGPKELIKQLKEYTISSSDYIKKRLVSQSKVKVKRDDIETVQLPSFLLKMKKGS